MADFSDFGKIGVGTVSAPMAAAITIDPAVDTNVLLDSCKLVAGVNTQFDLAFDGSAYVTAFGPKLSALTLSGLEPIGLLKDGCGGQGAGKLLAYFKTNSPSASTLPIVRILYGDAMFSGVLTDIAGDTESVGTLKCFRFTLVVMGRLESNG
jgi:hypothetical protein